MEEGRGWNGKERKSKNILMFEKREEMNKIRYGGIRGGKLVIMRAKGDRLESCHAFAKRGGGFGGSVRNGLSNLIHTELLGSTRRQIRGDR